MLRLGVEIDDRIQILKIIIKRSGMIDPQISPKRLKVRLMLGKRVDTPKCIVTIDIGVVDRVSDEIRIGECIDVVVAERDVVLIGRVA